MDDRDTSGSHAGPLTPEEFNELWKERDFSKVVYAAVVQATPGTDTAQLRYRRIILEGRVAKAQYDMVWWTRAAVFAAVVASVVSIIIAVVK